MSLLSAVLQEVDKVSTEDLKKHLDILLPTVQDLTVRLQHFSSVLQENFIDAYVHYKPTKSLENLNYKSRRAMIVSDYDKITEEVSKLNENFGNSDKKFRNVYEKFEKCYLIFNDLCIVIEGKKVLEQANHEFGRYYYMEAMLLVKNIQEKIRNVKFEGIVADGVANLKAQTENQLAVYSAHLSVEWEDLFSWEEKKGVNTLTYSLSVQQSDPDLLQKVLKTLHATDRLNTELGLFSHFFIDNLLHNVIRHNCDIFTEESIGALMFHIRISLNDDNKPNYQTIFLNLTAIFEFLQSTLGSQFDNGKKFIEIFAESIREKFFNKIIDDCVKLNLPSCDSSYQNYKNIVVEVDLFNKFLIDLKFVESEKSPLNKYVNDTECVLYNKKCDKLLSDTRKLLNVSLSQGTITVGTQEIENENDSIFNISNRDMFWDLNNPIFLPKCVISENVKKIMTMIFEHLEESIKLPENYRKLLVSYIRDIAIMYQCVVPKKFKVNLESASSDIGKICFFLLGRLHSGPALSFITANSS